jgi:hypothetical protein
VPKPAQGQELEPERVQEQVPEQEREAECPPEGAGQAAGDPPDCPASAERLRTAQREFPTIGSEKGKALALWGIARE